MKLHLLLIYIVTLLQLSTTATPQFRRQKVRHHVEPRFKDLNNCGDRPLRPYRFLRREVIVNNNDFVVSADGIIEKSSATIELLVLNVTKCADKSRNKCDQIENIEWKPSAAVCPLFAYTSVSPWWSALKAFHPPFGCVNQKGTFKMRNLTVDEAARRVMPLGKGNWIIEFEVYDEKLAPFACFIFEAGG